MVTGLCVAKTRQEIDFTRLLSRCEQDISAGKISAKDWRLERYIENLEDRLSELTKLTTLQPSRDSLATYKRKVRFLKGLLEAEKLNDASERLVAAQILTNRTGSGPHNQRTQEIFFKTQAKFRKDVREELLPLKRTNVAPSSDDTDLVLKYHHEMQEKVAAEMVSLAHNLKSNLTIANEIIRKDVQVLEGSAKHAETGLSGLKQNSDRLTDFVRRSCQYWLWISLFLVCMTFFWIVLFIRMFPKRSSI